MTAEEKEKIVKEFSGAGKRLLLFDYDGTLVEYNPDPAKAFLPDTSFRVLERLGRLPGTDVYIITGRGYESIGRLLDNLPTAIIAEHGGMVRENGMWKNQAASNNHWKEAVKPIMRMSEKSCQGSFIESKAFAMAWHYRNTVKEQGYASSRHLIDQLKETTQRFRLKVQDGNKVVEVMPEYLGKGRAVKRLLDRSDYDIIISIGDDVGDEEMFEYSLHHSNAFTIKVGEGLSSARYRLHSVSEVIEFLNILGS